MSLEHLMEKIWNDYSMLNPIVPKVHQLLKNKGEQIQNDHIAYRTVRHPGFGIESIAQHFIKYGYTYVNEYHFEEKKLYAHHFSHQNREYPKIFISEIILDDFSEKLKSIVKAKINQTPAKYFVDEISIYSGAPWGKINRADYLDIIDESEYAAWLLVFGFRANHFTVNANLLKSFKDLTDLNSYLKSNGISLNASGGEIKGNKNEFLEQSSTLANKIRIGFLEGQFEIPGCYYEFAKRYTMPNGELFQGFVATSANKIFESTDVKINK